MYKYGKNSLAKIETVDETLQLICHKAIEIMNNKHPKSHKVDFGISCGIRTLAIQKEMFAQGKSKADGVNNKSYHQYGLAVDFYAYVDGKANYDLVNIQAIALCFLQAASFYNVESRWGGHFSTIYDSPHFELPMIP